MPKTVEVQMQPVTSSNLAAIGYDASAKVLHVEFKNGTVYEYTGVPEDTYAALLGAESLGSYFHGHIRSEFPYSKI